MLSTPLLLAALVPVRVFEEEFARYAEHPLANGKIDYPVKLTGIGFSMFRKALIINQMKETGSTIRFRGFMSWSDK